jgi:hypothetical protein
MGLLRLKLLLLLLLGNISIEEITQHFIRARTKGILILRAEGILTYRKSLLGLLAIGRDRSSRPFLSWEDYLIVLSIGRSP